MARFKVHLRQITVSAEGKANEQDAHVEVDAADHAGAREMALAQASNGTTTQWGVARSRDAKEGEASGSKVEVVAVKAEGAQHPAPAGAATGFQPSAGAHVGDAKPVDERDTDDGEKVD